MTNSNSNCSTEKNVSNGVQIFNNEDFGNVRIMEKDNRILFCGNDIAKALGYKRTADAITSHCKGVCVLPTPTTGGVQDMKFVSEGDVYRLIAHSKLPSAVTFEKWVFDDVLPTIRKTGGYVSNSDLFVDTYFTHIDNKSKFALKTILKEFASLKDENNNLAKQAIEDRPKIEFAEAMVGKTSGTISMSDMAKLLTKNNIPIGRNKLIEFLREEKILDKKNVPYQAQVNGGNFIVCEKIIPCGNGCCKAAIITRVTGKGQKYIYNKIKDRYINNII